VHVSRQVVIAAIVGTTGGGIAGLWSVAQKPANATTIQTASKPVVTKPSPGTAAQTPASASALPHDATAVAAGVQAPPAAPKVTPPVTAPATPSASVPASTSTAGVDGGDVLLRARTLAQRPDVKALVALRESVVRRAAERGEGDGAATKQQLDEIDRYLEQARLLRLKLDAEEFKHAEAAANRPR
jgi:hypothetical protein